MLVIAIKNTESQSLFISQQQEDGTWVREQHSEDCSYWSRSVVPTYEEVIAYHKERGDIILHDEVVDLKESTAWMMLAEDIEAAPEDVDMRICLILESLEYFLSAVSECMRFVEKEKTIPYGVVKKMRDRFVEKGKTIPYGVVKKMRDRFQSHIDWDNREDYCHDGPSSWYNDGGPQQDGEFNCRRVLTCLWLSLEAEEEENGD